MKHADIKSIIHKHNLELIDWDEAEFWYGTDDGHCIVYTWGLGSDYWKDDGSQYIFNGKSLKYKSNLKR